jgi:hypothetical protein
MLSFSSFGQNNQVPNISLFPKEISAKITMPLDDVYQKFNFTNTETLSTQQKNLLIYFSNFSQTLSNRAKVSDSDLKIMNSLLESADKSLIFQWFDKISSSVTSFEDLHKAIVDKINNSNDLEQINQLVIIDYSLQIVNNEVTNTTITAKASAGCRGWWKCWGKCVSSIVGGGLTGAGTLGLAGAAVGTVTLPVVGTVAAGTVGAVVGGVGGALTGAAAGC